MYKDIFLTLIGSIFAAVGLSTGNTSQLIGAMLISPMMNPVNRMLIDGEVIKNTVQFMILVSFCIVVGILFNYIVFNNDPIPATPLIDGLTKYHGFDKNYLYDVIYGLAAGTGLYVLNNKSYVDETTRILGNVGVSTGITILPAFVATGMLIKTKNTDNVLNPPDHFNDPDNILIPNTSMFLGIVNLIAITTGYLSARYISDTLDPR